MAGTFAFSYFSKSFQLLIKAHYQCAYATAECILESRAFSQFGDYWNET